MSRPRVTKRLHMELDHYGGLVVVAPRHWSKRHINTTLAWNISHVEKFLVNARKKQLKPLQYIDGEQHLYLGTKYPLAIYHVAGKRNQVRLHNGEIRVHIPTPGREKIQTGVQNWYLRQAMIIFSERLSDIAQCAPWARGKDIPLKLRRMKRSWGNCSSRGVIKLNTHLVKASVDVIDSVIAHELCHLEEMNHSKAFYALLEGLNPDWQQDRARLRSEGFVYLLT